MAKNWEICPLCNGLGWIPTTIFAGGRATILNDSPMKVCNVCLGSNIINCLTGRPPKFTNKGIEISDKENE